MFRSVLAQGINTAVWLGRVRGAGVALLVSALAVPAVALAFNGHFTAGKLDGAHEVPPWDTNATGVAQFTLSPDGTALAYHLEVANIRNVVAAHIHVGAAGTDGGVVVWLYPSTSPGNAPAGGGRIQGRIASGTITAANLVGPLAGHPLSDLISEMEAGNAYVNVHTNDGVDPPNTGPGDFPGGEIRHQIRPHGAGP